MDVLAVVPPRYWLMVKSLPLPVVAVVCPLSENHTPQNLIIVISPALWMCA